MKCLSMHVHTFISFNVNYLQQQITKCYNVTLSSPNNCRKEKRNIEMKKKGSGSWEEVVYLN